ncbi:hypothetical protein PR048_022402, partial [Dryococelus australis]
MVSVAAFGPRLRRERLRPRFVGYLRRRPVIFGCLRGAAVVRLLASHQGEPGSIPDWVTPGFSHAGIVPDDNGYLPIPPAPSFRRCSIPTSLSPSSALKASVPRAAQISLLTHIRLFSTLLSPHRRRIHSCLPPFWLATLEFHSEQPTLIRMECDEIRAHATLSSKKLHIKDVATKSECKMRTGLRHPVLYCGATRPASGRFTSCGNQGVIVSIPLSYVQKINQIKFSVGKFKHCTHYSPLICRTTLLIHYKLGAAVAERLACSPAAKANRVQSLAGSLPDFRKRESCRTIPLVGGFSRGSPVSPALSFRRCSVLTSLHPHRLSRPRCYEPPESLHSLTLPTLPRVFQWMLHRGRRCLQKIKYIKARHLLEKRGRGGVAARLLASHLGDTGLDSWWGRSRIFAVESCLTPLVDGLSRGSPVLPPPPPVYSGTAHAHLASPSSALHSLHTHSRQNHC